MNEKEIAEGAVATALEFIITDKAIHKVGSVAKQVPTLVKNSDLIALSEHITESARNIARSLEETEALVVAAEGSEAVSAAASATSTGKNISKAVEVKPLISDSAKIVLKDTKGILEIGAETFEARAKTILEFINEKKAFDHFCKHGQNIAEVLGEIDYDLTKYLNDSYDVIKNGKFIPERNAFVKLIGSGEKDAVFGFVGIDRQTGKITTFHIKTAAELSKIAPSLGIDINKVKKLW